MKKKILMIRNDHIGDLVLSTNVFREIKKFFPDSEISLIVSRLNRKIVEKNKNIDKIIEIEIPSYKIGIIFKYFKMAFLLRRKKFDYGVDLRGSIMNSFFLLWLAGVKKRISRTDAHPGISKILTKQIKLNKKDHLVRQNIDIINAGFEINSKNYWPEVITDKGDEKDVEDFLKKRKLKKYICICPLTNLKYKQWDLNNFKKLIKWIEKNYGDYKILLLGLEKEREILDALASETKSSDVVLDFNIRRLSILFKKSSLVIAQDGGPMQIAWVVKSKLIALIPNFEDITYSVDPLGKNTTTIKDPDKIMVFTEKCMKKELKIELEDVKKAVKEKLI